MWQMIKKLVLFRMSQKSAKGAAKLLGFKRLGGVIGLIGGLRAMRRHA